ncbi:MAG: diguanylate cyclase [Ideonella sp.]|nr:diguanylate cyclase [Ideonella sp.]
MGATIGLAFCPNDARDAAQLLHAADTAMYAAKRAGKNTFRKAQGHDAAV